MTRGERIFNPGCIRHVAGVTWVGESPDQSSDDAFVVFTSPIYGIRAIARIMLSYAREGLNTVAAIINRWAPVSENNTAAYISAVCEGCSVGPSETIDVQAKMPELVKAIIVHENGGCIYSDTQIQAGIALA